MERLLSLLALAVVPSLSLVCYDTHYEYLGEQRVVAGVRLKNESSATLCVFAPSDVPVPENAEPELALFPVGPATDATAEYDRIFQLSLKPRYAVLSLCIFEVRRHSATHTVMIRRDEEPSKERNPNYFTRIEWHRHDLTRTGEGGCFSYRKIPPLLYKRKADSQSDAKWECGCRSTSWDRRSTRSDASATPIVATKP